MQLTIEFLLCVCQKELVLGGTALNWFRSYLEDWSTQVDIDGELSDPAISRFGLPQGSVVGPIGFTAYILPLQLATLPGTIMFLIMFMLTIFSYM